MTAFLSKMEEIYFPIDYTDGLKEVYFTHLSTALEGDYDACTGKMRVGCGRKVLDRVHQVFVHEVGHHVDELEGFSDKQELIDEYETHGSIMGEEYDLLGGISGDYQVGEYFALGFELYHSHRNGMNRCNSYPALFSVIDELHKRTK